MPVRPELPVRRELPALRARRVHRAHRGGQAPPALRDPPGQVAARPALQAPRELLLREYMHNKRKCRNHAAFSYLKDN